MTEPKKIYKPEFVKLRDKAFTDKSLMDQVRFYWKHPEYVIDRNTQKVKPVTTDILHTWIKHFFAQHPKFNATTEVEYVDDDSLVKAVIKLDDQYTVKILIDQYGALNIHDNSYLRDHYNYVPIDSIVNPDDLILQRINKYHLKFNRIYISNSQVRIGADEEKLFDQELNDFLEFLADFVNHPDKYQSQAK